MPDHYETLGLPRRCSGEEIRIAYRLLARKHHPDANGGSPESVAQTQSLNAAYEILGDPSLRRAYDRELADLEKPAPRGGRIERNISQDVHLQLEEFLRGTSLNIRVNDPANAAGAEEYELAVPAGTAPGARFRVPRDPGGFVIVKVRARPDARFKPRGSDLRCDLRISAQRASAGGWESVRGITGMVRVEIPKNAARGEIIRVPGEGLPKLRGGRGDLLFRIMYRPEVRVTRS